MALGQPAAAIMDAESSESGEILSAGLHDGRAALVVSSAAPAPASSSLPLASVETPADSAPQNGAGGIDVPCFLDGGRLIYEGSLAAHGYQRYTLKWTFQASCFKSGNAGEVQMSRFGHMEPVALLAVWHLQGRCLETRRQHLRSPQSTAATKRDWLLTNGHMS